MTNDNIEVQAVYQDGRVININDPISAIIDIDEEEEKKTNKNSRNIISGDSNLMNELKKYPSLLLRLNKIFKTYGVDGVNFTDKPENLQIEDKLTLYFIPFGFGSYEFLSCQTLGPILKEFHNKKNSHDFMVMNEDDLKFNYEPVRLDNVIIGAYARERNIIYLFLDIFNFPLSTQLKNDSLFYLLEEFNKSLQKLKPQVEDTKELKKMLIIKEFFKSYENKINNIKRNIHSVKSDIQHYTTNLLSKHQNLISYNNEIDNIKESLPKMQEGLFNQIEEIKKYKFVKRVGLSSKGLRVDFQKIFLNIKGEKIEIGECYIYITPTGIKIKNKQAVSYDGLIYHSPHISGNTICYGNMSSKVSALLADCEFKSLVYLLYHYLKTVNTGDTYLNLYKWIRAKLNGDSFIPGKDTVTDEMRTLGRKVDPSFSY